ncbi:D-hexose-6-phosphate mutarotase [Janthinobacterium fluminis]|uniref:Putative glucose-6-phosphate 1-epimerase n=1 Tax=Janthinobacterium fluminis TaxID=2987524 RepID=A0ABT5K1F2_9BURK|nr:D-hexose-6-phosphate mutarotase [Janthinobacterium fluminis]MDC8758813.1 D-hexose-6-phosphate mutarotase [Janthinobacterium fluminis]
MQLTEFGKLPAVCIRAADGAQAIVTLYGGHLVSWRSADGRERLFCSARSALDGSRAIRGGVPLIFPQFGARGDGLRHGFARVSNWRLAGGGRDGADGFAEFSLAAGDVPVELAAAWPFAFELTFRVALHGDALALSFSVRNTGTAAFPFSAALHSYFLVEQLERCELGGLQHVRFADESGAMALQETAALHFSDKLDRIYYQLPAPLSLRAGDAALRLEQEGFTDAVVWNPGAADAAALADMEDEEYRRFVCVEAALIEPDVLAAGAEWRGVQRIVAR